MSSLEVSIFPCDTKIIKNRPFCRNYIHSFFSFFLLHGNRRVFRVCNYFSFVLHPKEFPNELLYEEFKQLKENQNFT